MPDALSTYIGHRFSRLHGSWVNINSGYERALAQTLGMQVSASRYWDATWDGRPIEFKKGRSIWLDLVRYSEVLLARDAATIGSVRTLFFEPTSDRLRIKRVACVESEDLIAALALNRSDAERLIELKDRLPRSLNAQASMTWSDVLAAASFVVDDRLPSGWGAV